VNRLVATLEAAAGSGGSSSSSSGGGHGGGSNGRAGEGLDVRVLNGRTVVPTPLGAPRQAVGPKRGASRSGKTAYAEPWALVGPTDAFLAAVGLREAEEATARRWLSAEVRAHAKALAAAVRSAAVVDASVARAR
jgi:dsDNA-specific endonuclease/ATPase MutS2